MDLLPTGFAALIQIAMAVVAWRAMKDAADRLPWILIASGAGLFVAGNLVRLLADTTSLHFWLFLPASAALLAGLFTLLLSQRSQDSKRTQTVGSRGRLDAMLELDRRAMGGADLKSVQELACSLVAKILQADSVLVLEREAGLHSLTTSAHSGWRSPPAALRFSVEDPVISRLLSGTESESWESKESGEQGLLTELLARDGAAVITGTAIAGRLNPTGVLLIHRRHEELFAPEDLKFLDRVARVLAFARRTRAHQSAATQLDSIHQKTSVLSFAFGPDESISFMNESGQELLGFTPRQQAGLDLSKLYPEWALKRMRDEALPRASEAGFWSGETAIRSRSGREIALYQTLLAHRKTTGEVAVYSCFAYDLGSFPLPTSQGVTDSELRNRLRALDGQLDEARKDTEVFAESTGRRLREPLGAISSFCKTLLNRHLEEMNSQVLRYVQLINKATANAGQVTIRLNQVARLARHPLNIRQVDMAKLAQATWSELADEESEEQVQLRMRTLFPVPGDEPMLRRTFHNLLSNSLKYTREVSHPEIEIGSRVEGSRYVYYVRDNGIGFDMEDLGKLFGLFQQLHNGEEEEGAGMGLYEVKHIVQRHGGEVWAQGGSGLGATIFFSLPNSQEE